MPADDPERRASASLRFHSYADDTPREHLDRAPPPQADDQPLEFDRGVEPKAAPPRRVGWWVGGAGLTAALGVAFAVSFITRPSGETPTPAAHMGVEVAARTPAAPIMPPVAGSPKLEVLPPDQPAPVSQARIEPPAAAVAVAPARGQDVAATTPETIFTPLAAAPEPPALQVAPPPLRSGPPPRRSYACQDLPSRAMAIVCGDARLARLDLRMKHAYEAALANGASPGALRADQDDWLEVREEAAHVSRSSVASIYRQRIAELEDLAFR